MTKYIHLENVTSEVISARTGITVRTVDSLRAKDAGDVKHDLKLLIALAVGLHMTPDDGNRLINLNGQFLRDNKPTERYYKYLLSVGSFYCVAACNDYLVEHDCLPLTDNEKISCYD